MKDLSIIIISYNAKSFLEKCLQSIYGTTRNIDFMISVVDNNSKDGSPQMVRENFPEVKLIENKRNLGFAKANNQVIREAEAKFYLLLNSDTKLFESSVETMLGFMKSHPRAGVVGPLLINADGTDQGTARAFPTPWAAFFGRKSLLTRMLPNNRFSRRYMPARYPNSATNPPFDVDWMSGACLMIRRETIADTGLLDENFFFYWEDADWCHRIKDKSWEVWCVPQAKVIHYEGGNIREQGPRMIAEFHKSAFYYYCKHHIKNPLNPLRVIALFGLAGRALLLIAMSALSGGFKKVFLVGKRKTPILSPISKESQK